MFGTRPHPADGEGGRPPRGAPRAAALFGVTLATAVAQPSMLVAIPFLALAAASGLRGGGAALAAVVAVFLAVTGAPRDGFWYIERGWAVLIGGIFAALTVHAGARSRFLGRALASVACAAGATAALLALRPDAWGAVDWTIRDRMAGGVETAIEALRVVRGGETLPPALVAAVHRTVEIQASVFPAMLGIGSVAALGVAWWLYRRLAFGDDRALAPLRDLRFNDHLVWLLIGGLLLLVASWGDAVGRVGANAVIFMSALYAARGAAVILFLSGGLTFFGYVLLGLGLVLVPPLVLTGAVVVGIGDTWFDVRAKLGKRVT